MGRKRVLTDYAIDALEAVLVSFMLAGVLWNVLAGYGIVPPEQLSINIVLTTGVLFVVLMFDVVDDVRTVSPR